MLRKLVLGSPRPLGTIHAPNAKLHSTSHLAKKKDNSRSSDSKTPRKDKCEKLQEPICCPKKHPCSDETCQSETRYPVRVHRKSFYEATDRIAQNNRIKNKTDQLQSMWEDAVNPTKEQLALWTYPPECCPKCPHTPFDVLYYRPSNKCRQYQRTWWECCPKMVPKRVCCWCDAIPPENHIRSPPSSSSTGVCSTDHKKSRLDCSNEKALGCPRVQLPGCRAARVPPTCDIVRRPKVCDKPKCPYPSYSECRQLDPADIPQRPAECRCLKLFSTCDAHRADIRRDAIQSKFCECPTCK
ncbi:uncharacterized protein LOC6580366 [Drosophila mojavensis]|uniref:Uncharacterized protein n=1 Tax=Drosophila mojavensis TaxID=7230 RepID=B4KPF2_DROMO|nr:uncharacterized protein LOC6580366 [Drosophila mojavensis]EDW10148.1 uncharacterized protein Dmoj_GI18687 [Drosophila mojavensis]